MRLKEVNGKMVHGFLAAVGQELGAAGLQSLYDEAREVFEQFLAGVVVPVAFGSQTVAVEYQRTSGSRDARVEVPPIRREQPRPAQHVTVTHGLHGRESLLRRRHVPPCLRG